MNKELRNKLDELHRLNQEEADLDELTEAESLADGEKSSPASEAGTPTSKVEQQAAPTTNKITETAEYKQLDDQYKRLLADQQNIAKRMARERQESHKYAAVSTVEKILPALDNFDFAKKSINENTKHEDIVKSIEMLKDQILQALSGVGLETIRTTGVFDANLHEAVSTIKDPDKEEGSILEVVKEGYKIADRVIRPAVVVVSSKE